MAHTRGHGTVVFRPDLTFNGVKVFSATMLPQREHLGEVVTDWPHRHRHYIIVEITVTQSSDASFHCVAITVFYWEPPSPRRT